METSTLTSDQMDMQNTGSDVREELFFSLRIFGKENMPARMRDLDSVVSEVWRHWRELELRDNMHLTDEESCILYEDDICIITQNEQFPDAVLTETGVMKQLEVLEEDMVEFSGQVGDLEEQSEMLMDMIYDFAFEFICVEIDVDYRYSGSVVDRDTPYDMIQVCVRGIGYRLTTASLPVGLMDMPIREQDFEDGVSDTLQVRAFYTKDEPSESVIDSQKRLAKHLEDMQNKGSLEFSGTHSSMKQQWKEMEDYAEQQGLELPDYKYLKFDYYWDGCLQDCLREMVSPKYEVYWDGPPPEQPKL